MLVASACVAPRAYRYDGRILQPNTVVGSKQQSTIFIARTRASSSCRIRATPGQAIERGRFVRLGVAGNAALSLTFRPDYFSATAKETGLRGALRSEIRNWLSTSGAFACLGLQPDVEETDPTVEFIARQAYAQRPMTAAEAVFTWFGPGEPTPHANLPRSRVIILRPGMQVCAHDIVEPQRQSVPPDDLAKRRDEPARDAVKSDRALPGNDDPRGRRFEPREPTDPLTAAEEPEPPVYAVGGTTCATVTDGPNGTGFSPVAELLDPPLSGSPWATQPGFRRVSSWDEIQVPASSSGKHIFAIVHGGKMPVYPPVTTDDYSLSRQSFIVRIDADAQIKLANPACTEKGQESRVCRGIEALQFGSYNNISKYLCGTAGATCIAFGRRATFTVDIPVIVNRQRIMLPVGSTIATIAGQVAPDFLATESSSLADGSFYPADHERSTRSLRKLKLYRWFEGRRTRVAFGDRIADFPLQPGDVIKW